MGEQDANQRFAAEATIEPDHIARARAHALELGAAPDQPRRRRAVRRHRRGVAGAQHRRDRHRRRVSRASGCCTARRARRSRRSTTSPSTSRAARQAFADAKVPPARARFITGRAAEVLPRMNEASYDIVLVDADPEGVIEYVEHGLRLVRAGGTVLVPRVLARRRRRRSGAPRSRHHRLPLAHPGDPGLPRGDRRAVDRRRGAASAHDGRGRLTGTDATAPDAKNGRSEGSAVLRDVRVRRGSTTPPSTS